MKCSHLSGMNKTESEKAANLRRYYRDRYRHKKNGEVRPYVSRGRLSVTSRAEYHRQYRASETGKQVHKRCSKNCRQRRRDKIDQLKTNPCTDCKNLFLPEVMDFDHRESDKKGFSVARFPMARWDDIVLEVAKCDLVCANCHRVRTARRRAGLPATLPPPDYEI